MPTHRMTKAEAITRLKLCQQDKDTEAAHGEADEVLCKLLDALGYREVVREYHKVSKWYA